MNINDKDFQALKNKVLYIEVLYQKLQEYFFIYSQKNTLSSNQKTQIDELLKLLSNTHDELISEMRRIVRGIADKEAKRVIRIWRIRDWWSVASISNDIASLFDPIPSARDILFKVGDLAFDQVESQIWKQIRNDQIQFEKELKLWLLENDSTARGQYL